MKCRSSSRPSRSPVRAASRWAARAAPASRRCRDLAATRRQSDARRPPPPPPQPTSRTIAGRAAIAVRPALKAPKPTHGACDDRRMRPSPIGRPATDSPRGSRRAGRWSRGPDAPLLRPHWRQRLGRAHQRRVGRAPGPARRRAAPRPAASPSAPSTSAPGPATAALFLAREFPHARVRGVDISEEMIRRAQGRRSASTPRAGSPSRSPTPPPCPSRTSPSTWSPSSTCRRSSPRSPASCARAAT